MLIDETEDFSRLVRAERQARGISQVRMAADIGVSRRWLIAFETGDISNPGFDTILKILSYLDLRINLEKKKPVALYPPEIFHRER